MLFLTAEGKVGKKHTPMFPQRATPGQPHTNLRYSELQLTVSQLLAGVKAERRNVDAALEIRGCADLHAILSLHLKKLTIASSPWPTPLTTKNEDQRLADADQPRSHVRARAAGTPLEPWAPFKDLQIPGATS